MSAQQLDAANLLIEKCNTDFGEKIQARVSELKDLEDCKSGVSNNTDKAKIVTDESDVNSKVKNDSVYVA